jgi:hypothetical protein
MSNISKMQVSQGTVSRLMHEVYAYPITLCMHEKIFNVASKHCRANLVSGRIPVIRKILSAYVYDKITL